MPYVLLGMILPALIAAGIGGAKKRGSGIWFLLGLIFSWIAVLIVACLSYPHEDSSEVGSVEQRHPDSPSNVPSNVSPSTAFRFPSVGVPAWLEEEVKERDKAIETANNSEGPLEG